ncbi:acyltransferase family protein [Edaphobacter albus]|uniref:acyltransferase family protein n=1 Tax=Edaphobacter sp. 4G125 TaxID=2763071 RepID=UPI00164759AD|nr:acyltransferase [Edaphobacter sp. 4G125]QNI35934.1 acyltransferase [Edaphobacter sp. 4G125]
MTTEQLLEHGFVANPNVRTRRPPLDALTGLRFFAAFYVMSFHYGAAFTHRAHMPRAVTNFLEHGSLGVCLFFLLSGFILFYTYAGNLKTGRDRYRFFVARFCRIYPVYLLAAAVTCFAVRGLPTGHNLMYFTLLQSWTPAASPSGYAWIMQAWTLSVETFFYCSFPLLLPLVERLRSRHLTWMLLFIVGITAGLLELPFQHAGMTSPVQGIFLPLLRLPEFILGMLLGSLFLHRTTGSTPWWQNDWITLIVMFPPIALIASGKFSKAVALACLFWFIWAIYRLASGKGWLTKLLSSRIFILLGGASYSIYLLQWPIRDLMRQYVAPLHPGLDAILSPVILITLSILIFLYYEEPLRERLRTILASSNRS